MTEHWVFFLVNTKHWVSGAYLCLFGTNDNYEFEVSLLFLGFFGWMDNIIWHVGLKRGYKTFPLLSNQALKSQTCPFIIIDDIGCRLYNFSVILSMNLPNTQGHFSIFNKKSFPPSSMPTIYQRG